MIFSTRKFSFNLIICFYVIVQKEYQIYTTESRAEYKKTSKTLSQSLLENIGTFILSSLPGGVEFPVHDYLSHSQ